MAIILDRPPMFERILEVFPSASNPGVIFAWGKDIYNPSNARIPKAIQKHEEEHGRRQGLIGIEQWWDNYLRDEEFRYLEEVFAHREEYLSLAKATVHHDKRRKFLRLTAGRLIAPLYNYKQYRSFDQALEDLVTHPKFETGG